MRYGTRSLRSFRFTIRISSRKNENIVYIFLLGLIVSYMLARSCKCVILTLVMFYDEIIGHTIHYFYRIRYEFGEKNDTVC